MNRKLRKLVARRKLGKISPFRLQRAIDRRETRQYEFERKIENTYYLYC